MLTTEVLRIAPFTHPVRGEVALPGSKSITNRALMLGALSDGPVTIENALFSDDTRIMSEALRQLGFSVEEDAPGKRISVQGLGGVIPAEKAELSVGLAGTAARFLTALCASSSRGTYKIDGTFQMRVRPMKGLIQVLRLLGAEIRCTGQEGFLPIEIEAHGLRGGPALIDASESSQMLSALLMVAPYAKEEIEIRPKAQVRRSFVEMTGRMMADFGAAEPVPDESDSSYRIPLGRFHSPGTYAVEPDASSASYFFALPMVTTGTLFLPGLHADNRARALQGDAKFADVARSLGCELIERDGGVAVQFNRMMAANAESVDHDFHEFSDTFLTLAAVAPLIEGTTRITGIAHTRKQETDRVSGVVRELKRLGQYVKETDDSITIEPRPLRPDKTIETYGDHRFAMSFAILGCHDFFETGEPWLTISNPNVCAKTFPNFFILLDRLRQASNIKTHT